MLLAVATGFSPDQFFAMLLGSVVAVVLLAVALPFTASLILDAVILVVRGRGFRGLLVAVPMTVATAVAGVVALAAGGTTTAAAFPSSASFLLPFSCALALLAFVVRQIKGAAARR